MAIQFTDVPVDGLVPLICKIVVCIDWIAPTHKVVTEVKSIDVKTIAITATIFRNLLSRIAASFDGSVPVLLRTPKTKPVHPACALPWLSLRLPFFRGGRLMGGQTMPNCHSQKTRGRRAEKHPKNRLSVNHFGNHFPLFLPSF